MFIKCPCTWDHEYPSTHGLSSIVASRFRCKLKNLEFQTNGGSLTWYAPTATPLTPYFNPLHQPKTPVFTKKLSPKVLFFPHCPKFWKLFTQRPQIDWKKRYPNVPYFCHWKTPNFLPCMQVFEGNVAPSNTVRSWKILYSWDRIVQFGEYF